MRVCMCGNLVQDGSKGEGWDNERGVARAVHDFVGISFGDASLAHATRTLLIRTYLKSALPPPSCHLLPLSFPFITSFSANVPSLRARIALLSHPPYLYAFPIRSDNCRACA